MEVPPMPRRRADDSDLDDSDFDDPPPRRRRNKPAPWRPSPPLLAVAALTAGVLVLGCAGVLGWLLFVSDFSPLGYHARITSATRGPSNAEGKMAVTDKWTMSGPAGRQYILKARGGGQMVSLSDKPMTHMGGTGTGSMSTTGVTGLPPGPFEVWFENPFGSRVSNVFSVP